MMKSKTIRNAKASLRNLLNTLRNELRLPGCRSKKREVEVSWPQSVVKTVEAGANIERPVEIKNAHERLILQHPNRDIREIAGNNNATQSEIINNRRRSGTTKILENKERNFSAVEDGGDNEITREVKNEFDPEISSTIHTASVREWMSEPRASWRQSAPRIETTVSKIRPMKPKMRQVQFNPHPNGGPDMPPPH